MDMNWEQLQKSVKKITDNPPPFTFYSKEEKDRLSQSIRDKRITGGVLTEEERLYMASNSSWFDDDQPN